MWSPNPRPLTSQNRVSPIQKGINKSWGSDAKSASGVHVEVRDLTKLIRKRKYNKIDSSQSSHLFPVEHNTETKWTPTLTKRIK